MPARFLRRAPSALLLAVLACDPGPVDIPPAPADIATLEIESVRVYVERTRSVTLRAVVRDEEGGVRSDVVVSWSSAIPGIATVSAEGVVTGVQPGETRVIAAVGPLRDSVTIEVLPLPIQSLTILADTLVLGEEGVLRPPVLLIDQAGDTVRGRFDVTSSDLEIIRPHGDGHVVGVSRGEAMIIVSAGAAADTVPARVVTGYLDVAAGYDHSCALRVDGRAYCWGRLFNGSAGDGRLIVISGVPGLVAGPHRYRSIAAGTHTHCALSTEDEAWCWGENEHGALGNGERATETPVPTRVEGEIRFTVVRMGDEWACGLDLHSALYCWGYNAERAAAAPPGISEILTPRRVETDRRFANLSAGGFHGCGLSEALADEGRAFCWGSDYYGQLGRGEGNHTGHEPGPADTEIPFELIEAGVLDTCALDRRGGAFCWGYGSDRRPMPVPGLPELEDLAAGSLASHRCGLTARGRAWCWGENESGQLGDGSLVSRRTGSPVDGGLRFRRLAVGWAHTCGITTANALYCWGTGLAIGAGERTESYVPVLVVEPNEG